MFRGSGESRSPKSRRLFRIVRKTDSKFFAASFGLRSETTDFYLIKARKIAPLVGLDRNKQEPYPRETSHNLAIRKAKPVSVSCGGVEGRLRPVVQLATSDSYSSADLCSRRNQLIR